MKIVATEQEIVDAIIRKDNEKWGSTNPSVIKLSPESILDALQELARTISELKRYYVFFVDGDKITIQRAEYIEDGWYIEVTNDVILLYEIPQFGGNPILIGQFSTINKAIEKAESLI